MAFWGQVWAFRERIICMHACVCSARGGGGGIGWDGLVVRLDTGTPYSLQLCVLRMFG
jgi:hypothetical protein